MEYVALESVPYYSDRSIIMPMRVVPLMATRTMEVVSMPIDSDVNSNVEANDNDVDGIIENCADDDADNDNNSETTLVLVAEDYFE